MAWEPIAADPEGTREIVREIVHALETSPHDDPAHSDLAILRGYLATDGTVADPDDIVARELEAAVSLLSTIHAGPGLYGGAAGIGWAVEHLVGDPDVGATIDGMLARRLEGAWNAEYDLISGLVGIGIYALERESKALSERVLDQLEALAQPRGAGLAWFTPPELLSSSQVKIMPEGYWNLGMSHGVPGIIGLLARCELTERVRRLLDGAVAYVLDAEPAKPGGRYPPWHPWYVPIGRRVAWCYGDLGVALALFSAATACDHAGWRAEALALARTCAATSVPDSEVIDTGLCHGAAGAAHMFNRFYQATHELDFREAASRWLEHTVAMRGPEPIGGFPARRDDQAFADASLLSGAAGVALALHAACSEVEPRWDRMLLADLRASGVRASSAPADSVE